MKEIQRPSYEERLIEQLNRIFEKEEQDEKYEKKRQPASVIAERKIIREALRLYLNIFFEPENIEKVKKMSSLDKNKSQNGKEKDIGREPGE